MEQSNLFQNACALIGQEEASVQKFAEQLHSTAAVTIDNLHVRAFVFQAFGLEALLNKRFQQFTTLAFFIDTPATQDHRMVSYSAPFFNSILPVDALETVQKKIVDTTVVSKIADEWALQCSLPGKRLTFYFNSAGEQMRLVTVKKKNCEQNFNIGEINGSAQDR